VIVAATAAMLGNAWVYERRADRLRFVGDVPVHQTATTGIGPNNECLGKPFHYQEVAARIRAVLRRRDSRREGPRRIGDLFIDPSRREVRVGDREVHLANKEFSLLRALAADPYRVFTKEDLLREVWGFRSMGRTRTLDSHASRLRRKLDPRTGHYVVNCWGVGYRLLEG
jgi:DNA-binding response OmpR family regulator